MNTQLPHWYILGAGAIGSLWAAYAFQASEGSANRTTLILRNAQRLSEYQQHGGLHLQPFDGAPLTSLPVAATCPENLDQHIHHLLVCCKAQQTEIAMAAIAPHLAPRATLVLLQNGLGVAERLATSFPLATVLQASTTEGVYRAESFSLVHAGRGQTLLGHSAARLARSGQHPLAADALQQLAQSLSFTPLQVSVSNDIDQVLWRKLAVNCVINPLTAKYRCRNGELLQRPEAVAEMNTLVAEIQQLFPDPDLLQTVQQVARNTAQNRSSMLQDVEAGRETEIDFITGFLCQQAQKQGLDLPGNESLLETIRALPRP